MRTERVILLVKLRVGVRRRTLSMLAITVVKLVLNHEIVWRDEQGILVRTKTSHLWLVGSIVNLESCA